MPPLQTEELVDELAKLDGVISLSVVRGASVKPEGDVLTVHALNRGADEVLRLAEAASEHGRVSVSTGELASLVDPEHERQVAKDVDEALWEDVETRLRHQSRTTANYLLLMALGGAIAATGFAVHQPTEQALSFVAGAVVAPGFEPLANVSVGLALRRWALAARALGSAALGYLGLFLSAALVFLVLRLTGAVTVGGFAHNPGWSQLVHPVLRGVLLSACGALAGMLMLTTYRQYLLPGALIALRAIESAALVGAALIAGEPGLAFGALGRFLISAVLIIAAGVLVVWLKQTLVHRRKPVVTGSGRRAESERARAKRAWLLATNAIRYGRSSSYWGRVGGPSPRIHYLGVHAQVQVHAGAAPGLRVSFLPQRTCLHLVARLIAQGRLRRQRVGSQRVEPQTHTTHRLDDQPQALEILTLQLGQRAGRRHYRLDYAQGDLRCEAGGVLPHAPRRFPKPRQDLVRRVRGDAALVDEEELLLQPQATMVKASQ